MNRDRVIVGLIGGIGSGKSTAAKILCDRHRFVELAIAEKLKQICVDLFNLDPDCAWGTQAKKAEPIAILGGVSTRQLLEETAAHFRKYNEFVWLDAAERSCDAHRLVLPDVRYPNDRLWVKDRGGIIVKMNVLGETPPSTGHPSDMYWRNMAFDYQINAERGRIDRIAEQLHNVLVESRLL